MSSHETASFILLFLASKCFLSIQLLFDTIENVLNALHLLISGTSTGSNSPSRLDPKNWWKWSRTACESFVMRSVTKMTSATFKPGWITWAHLMFFKPWTISPFHYFHTCAVNALESPPHDNLPYCMPISGIGEILQKQITLAT